ncbi:unknown [Clostridium sp. CAG:451]|nr:unknown [Clostridium sp. CAG:451]
MYDLIKDKGISVLIILVLVSLIKLYLICSIPSTINIMTKDAITKGWLEDKYKLGGKETSTIA